MKNYKTITPFLLFILDYNTNILINKPILFTLLCWYLLHLYASKTSQHSLIITILLLGLSSFAFHGFFGLIYLSLIPAILLCLLCKRWLTYSKVLPILSLLLTLTLNNLIIAHFLKLPFPLKNCTIWQFFVNIVVLSIMSLKIHGDGRLGNRL